MKLIFVFSALFFSSIFAYAGAETNKLENIEVQHAQQIVNCPFTTQSQSNKDQDKRIVASLTEEKVTKESKQKIVE